MKKRVWKFCILLCAAGLVWCGCQKKPAHPRSEENSKSSEIESPGAGQKTQRQETAIIYDNVYTEDIADRKEARAAIEKEGEAQREACKDPDVQRIEAKMEETYGIFQVTLGEMEPEVAEKVESAFSYMYGKYPVLQGRLTNLTIGNIRSGAMAETHYRDFISPTEGIYPIVMKHEVVLNGRDFLNPGRMENLIRKSVSEGHWMADMKIEAIVVHELGHVLVNEVRMERYGLDCCYYIEKQDQESYAAYNTDILKDDQTTAYEILSGAYERYLGRDSRSMEEACAAISGYASGIQPDGGIAYEEACAEAFVDGYLHGENAAEFSLLILEEIENWLFTPVSMSSVEKPAQT